jgi:FkbM family methyltransferase
MAGDIKAAKRLAADTHSRQVLQHDLMNYPFMRSNSAPEMHTVTLKTGVVLSYRAERGDIWAVRQMWIDEVCRLPMNVAPDTIFDLGANIGMAGLWLAKTYGGHNVIAVEPVPANASLARQNLLQNGIASEVHEAAVAKQEGTAQFVLAAGSGNGRLSLPDETEAQTLTVPLITMDSLLETVPADQNLLLKMDIEGAEQQVLEDSPAWLDRMSSMLIEFHPPIADSLMLRDVLAKAGFRMHRVEANLTAFFEQTHAPIIPSMDTP